MTFALDFYGTRYLGIKSDVVNIISSVSESIVGLLRCAFAVAVLHSEITAVARRAAESQAW